MAPEGKPLFARFVVEICARIHALERKGVISSSRGALLVRTRKGIERSAGGTYGVPEKELRRLIVRRWPSFP
jgi:hypothetical protein